MNHDPYSSPYDNHPDRPAVNTVELKHSGLGIASFVIAIVACLSTFCFVLLISVMAVSTPGGINEESPQAVALGLGIMGSVGLGMLGLGLGIAAVFQSNRSKMFGVIGLVLNTLLMLGVFGMVVLGLSAEG